MSQTTFTILDDRRTLVVERTFRAPKRKVWAAWTTPELLERWWGPKGWKTVIKHMEFREGGHQHYGMVCEDPDQTDWYGRTSWGKSTYHRIDAENAFDYTDAFCDENAVVTPGMPVMEIRVAFAARDGSTTVTSTSVFATPEALKQVIDMGMEEGLTQTWDRLEATLGA